MAFADEKACMLARVTLIGCRDAAKIDARVQSYADVLPAYFEDSNTFDCNPQYLSALVACFSPASLLANCNIYAQSNTTPTDPGLWIDGNTESITIATSVDEFAIVGASHVAKLTILTGVTVGILTIGGGAILDVLDVQGTGAVGYLRVTGCRNYKSTLSTIVRGSTVNNVKIDPGTTFGDYDCLPVSGNCTSPVTNLAAGNQTAKSIIWTWATPLDTLYQVVKFRERGAPDWIIVPPEGDNDYGNWIDGGFVFNNLPSDTYFEISVTNYCQAGQPAASVNDISKTS